MKIKRIPSSKLINQYIQVRENIPKENKTNQSTDKVELSKESKTFSIAFKEAKKAINTRTPSELKRIQEVSRMIRNNEYFIKGQDVAEKILDE